MPYVESMPEFRNRMDCPHAFVNGRYLWENGGQSNGYAHLNPPADKWERLRLQAEYYAFILKREEKEYYAYQNACMEQLNLAKKYPNVPGPPPEAPELLRAGEDRMRKLRAKLDGIAAELRESPQAKFERQREDRERERLNRLQAQIADLRGDPVAHALAIYNGRPA